VQIFDCDLVLKFQANNNMDLLRAWCENHGRMPKERGKAKDQVEVDPVEASYGKWLRRHPECRAEMEALFADGSSKELAVRNWTHDCGDEQSEQGLGLAF
jgi:hypothetical protein